MSKPKLCLLIDNLGSGGAQRQIVLLATELAKLDMDVTLTYYGESTHMAYMLEGTSVKLDPITRNSPSLLRVSIKIIRTLLKQNPDVLISYLDGPNKISGIYKILKPKTKWIPSERSLCLESSRKEKIWRSLLYKNAHALISNSHAQNTWILKTLKANPEKCHVVWNGVHSIFFESIKRNKYKEKSTNFISMGRISHEKNPKLLISAIEKAKAEIPSTTTFSWYGDEDSGCKGLLQELKKLSEQKNIPISFFPAVKNAHDVTSNADCLILTSKFEGTPNVVLEAMASGTIVISSRVSDIPLIIKDGETGLLFDSDDPDGLASCIKFFLTMTNENRYNMAFAAREFAERYFAPNNLAINYIKIMEDRQECAT